MTSKNIIPACTRAIINLGAFRQNLRVIKSRIKPNTKIMAVVKSNAYGHGVKEISREAERNKVDYLAVARVFEGVEIREEGIRMPILACEAAAKPSIEEAILHNIDLTVVSLADAHVINHCAGALNRKPRIHIKVDTGMGRLGMMHTSAPEVIASIARLQHVEIAGVFSHFATSEESDQTFALEQLSGFNGVLEGLHRLKIEVPLVHMANSGAIFNLPQSHFDMVRPGISLYGYSPDRRMEAQSALVPVMSVVSRVSFLKSVKQSMSISYGRKYFTKTDTIIATIPIGYGDGFSRSLTNKAECIIKGLKYPIVGTICMDHVMADVGPENEVQAGDEVTLIGKNGSEAISCWDVAEKLGTIPYEITCLITPRVPRIYVDGQEQRDAA